MSGLGQVSQRENQCLVIDHFGQPVGRWRTAIDDLKIEIDPNPLLAVALVPIHPNPTIQNQVAYKQPAGVGQWPGLHVHSATIPVSLAGCAQPRC